jgi:hypothetical protein
MNRRRTEDAQDLVLGSFDVQIEIFYLLWGVALLENAFESPSFELVLRDGGRSVQALSVNTKLRVDARTARVLDSRINSISRSFDEKTHALMTRAVRVSKFLGKDCMHMPFHPARPRAVCC